jgi:HSP20 family molecular chaperone IbpA
MKISFGTIGLSLNGLDEIIKIQRRLKELEKGHIHVGTLHNSRSYEQERERLKARYEARKKAYEDHYKNGENNIRPPRRTVREPIYDIFNESNCITLIAELPGVEETDILLNLEDKRIVKLTTNPNSKIMYQGSFELPCNVEFPPAKKELKNGILSLQFKNEI